MTMVLIRPKKYRYLTVLVNKAIPGDVFALRYFPDLPQDIDWELRNVAARLIWLKYHDIQAYNKEIRKHKIVHKPPVIVY